MTTPDVVMRGLICCKFGGMCGECPYNLDDEQNEIDIEDCTKALAEDVYDYIKQLVTNTPRWISVKNELPKLGQKVIAVFTDGDKQIVDQARYSDGGFDFASWDYVKTVTHWQPMPEPPKEG